jgi:hypothetical protein
MIFKWLKKVFKSKPKKVAKRKKPKAKARKTKSVR